MTNDLEQVADVALDVVDPMANVDSMVGTANPTPEPTNFPPQAVAAGEQVFNTQNIDKTLKRGSINNNNVQQYG